MLGHWDAQGALAAEIARRFAGSIDGVNGFYRPLTLVTFAASYALAGGAALGWLAVNLALHLANAVLAAALVSALSGPRSRATDAAAVAAGILFFALSPGWEVAAWVASRYDALATFFTLAAALAFVRRRTGWALAATLAALLSKESGALAIVFVGLLAAAQEAAGGAATAMGAKRWLRRMAPWIAMGAAYAALRLAMFGSATRVYAGPPLDLLSGEHWRALFASAAAWAVPVFPGPGGAGAMLAASAAVVAGGLACAAARERAALANACATLGALAAALALLLPHLGGFEANGIGGRLFYQASAFYAIALGQALAEAALALERRRAVALAALAVGAALVAAHLAWGWDAARQYARAGASMRALAAALPKLAAQAAPGEIFLVVVPDSWGRVPFGRNAQAGLVLPPVQPRPLSRALLVQVENDLGGLDREIDAGMLAALHERPFFDVMEGRAGPGPWRRLPPARAYCWNAKERAMMPLAVDAATPGTVSKQVAQGYAARCAARG